MTTATEATAALAAEIHRVLAQFESDSTVVEDGALEGVPEMAERLSVSQSFLWGAVRQGVVPVVNLGNRTLIPVSWARELAASASVRETA